MRLIGQLMYSILFALQVFAVFIKIVCERFHFFEVDGSCRAASGGVWAQSTGGILQKTELSMSWRHMDVRLSMKSNTS